MSAQKTTIAPITRDQGLADGSTAPRPPTPEDIVEMLDSAQPVWAKDRAVDQAPSPSEVDASQAANGGERFETGLLGRKADFSGDPTPWPMGLIITGGGAFAALGAAYLLVFADLSPIASLSALATLCAGVFVLTAGAKAIGAPFFHARDNQAFAADDTSGRGLAGAEVLSRLNLSHFLIDSDTDARLITTPEGVVVYANPAYGRLAASAGAQSGAGLPPRLDRIFSSEGGNGKKLFSLARAAKSMNAAREEIFQTASANDGARGPRRRFDIAATPYPRRGRSDSDYVGWRIRELPIEEDAADALAQPYATLPMPIFAVDRRGTLLWANAAFYKKTGFDPNTPHSLDDLILGDASALAAALWSNDRKTAPAKVRASSPVGGAKLSAALDGQFTAFRRAGAGEGFAYVTMHVEEDDGLAQPAKIGGELSESPFGVAIVEGELGKDAKIVEANQAFLESFAEAHKGASIEGILSPTVIADLAAEAKKKPGAAPRSIEAPSVSAAGNAGAAADAATDAAARTFAIYAKALRRKRGGYGKRRTFLYSIEVTEQKRMQEGHVQDQKLKAIGNIAGEVAHDFNNILQVVLHTCEDLLMSHPAGDPAYQDLILIRENSQRAANLTAQLLAYSRKQTLTNTTQSITDLLVDFSRFLDRAVGEKVKIELKNGRALPPVRVDRTQLETALMNLAVNARDAMAPDGGRITITTSLTPKDAVPEALSGQLRLADHVLITVADTGPGVPQSIIEKIFDPFFTTKEPGKGTGLGLSAVQGVIGQMGGAITVENAPPSEDHPGGAVFRIFLPADELGVYDAAFEKVSVAGEAGAPSPGVVAAADCSGTGRILVVEDEPGVRLVVVKTLEKAGYDVVVADDGVDALELLQEDADFDLVISDIMMPEIDGPSMVATARAEHSLSAAVIFMSGYAESAVRDQLATIDDAQFIQKPFKKADLGVMVRAAIHGADAV
ncbi:MAG: ATP-binding protein [Pseudomonadota bacterium]